MEPKAIVPQSPLSFNDIEAAAWAAARRFAAELMRQHLANLDSGLAATRPAGLRHKGYRTRKVLTVFGDVEIRRRYYEDEHGRKRFLLDEAVGLEPRKRLSGRVRRVARKLCCDVSYRRATEIVEDLLGVRIEAQTGHTLVQELGQGLDRDEQALVEAVLGAKVVPKSGGLRSRFLCIEADGVNIRLQREGRRKSAEIKLGTAYDGWRKSAGRVGLSNKLVYGLLGSGGDFWDRFGLHINARWDLSATRRVVVGGDGAEWVEEGTKVFPGAEFQLDQYHLRRRLSEALGHEELARVVGDGLVAGDRQVVNEGLDLAPRLNPGRKDDIAALRAWIESNWDKAKDYRLRGGFVPSDARGTGTIESNVDKNVANRFKKRGRGWTIRGAGNLVQVMNHERRGGFEELEDANAAQRILAGADVVALRKAVESLDLPGRGPRAGIPLLDHGANGESFTFLIRNIISKGGLPTSA